MFCRPVVQPFKAKGMPGIVEYTATALTLMFVDAGVLIPKKLSSGIKKCDVLIALAELASVYGFFCSKPTRTPLAFVISVSGVIVPVAELYLTNITFLPPTVPSIVLLETL